jgi:hypothetical protein
MYELLPLAALVIFGILYSLGHKYYLEELKNGTIDLEKLKK